MKLSLGEILDAFKRAKPDELEAAAPVLREALDIAEAPAPVPPPIDAGAPAGRPVMSGMERRQLRAEEDDDRQRFEEERAALALREAAALKTLRAAEEEAAAARMAAHDLIVQAEYAGRHAERVTQLWDRREPLVDELIAKCQDEAVSLWQPSSATVPTSPAEQTARLDRIYSGNVYVRPVVNPYSDLVSNERFMEQRQRGLRELADTIRRWARAGSYDDASDLQAKFDAEYSKLPAVPSIHELARRVRQAGAVAPPPAA